MTTPLAEPLSLGIVGVASARARYSAALAALAEARVAGLADADARQSRAWAREVGRPGLFSSAAHMLAALPDLVGVVVALPLQEREMALEAAIEAGLPVLCDLPFTCDFASADALLRRAEAAGTRITPALPRRFDPWFDFMRQLIAAHEVGVIRHLRCDWNFPIGGPFAAENGDDPDGSRWTTLLPALLAQIADVSRWWLGEAYSVSADIDSAQYGAGALPAPRGGEALANLIVSHETAQSTFHFSRARSVFPAERYVATGEKGALELVVSAGERGSSVPLPLVRLHRPGQKSVLLPAPNPPPIPIGAWRSTRLLQSFINNDPEAPTATEGRLALELVHGAYLASREALKVSLPPRRTADLPS